MKSISDKIFSLRTAKATAVVRASLKTVRACMRGKTPKGAVIDVARVAGIMAAKKTAEVIPYCHPIQLDHVDIKIKGARDRIVITATASAIAKTGVEMEALTAASIAALTVYDMLKPIDDNLRITDLRLIEKHGGKSDFVKTISGNKQAAILIPSDRVSKKPKADLTGPYIYNALKQAGFKTLKPVIVPNDRLKIEGILKMYCSKKIDLVITSGGTGVGPRDKTVDATRNVIKKGLPGLAEAMRSYGFLRTPYAALSRGLAGVCDKTLIINLPGSPRAVKEYLSVVMSTIIHAFDMMEDKPHR